MKKWAVLLFGLMCSVLWVGNTFAADAPSLVFPNKLIEIDDRAFYGTTSIDDVVLPEGIQRIGEEAFGYSSLASIYLPESITHIADNAFVGCSDIQMTASLGSYAYDWAIEHGFISCAPAWGPSRIDYSNEELILFLTWPYAEAERYDVYRADSGSDDMQLVGSVTPVGTGSQGFSDGTIVPGQSYEYTLRLITNKSGTIFEEGYNDPVTIDVKDIYVGRTSGFTIGGVLENLSVYSKYAWEIESIPSWLNMSQKEGSAGKTTVQVYGKMNNTGEDRTGYIYFTSGEDLSNLRIQQIGIPFGLLNLKATASDTDARIDLSWSASDEATGYLVYRSHNAETGFAQIAETTEVSYSDTSAEYGSTYYYKVLEYADEFDGTRTIGYDDGSSVCASTKSQIAVPTSIKLTCEYPLVDMWIGDCDYLDAVIEPSVVDNDTLIWESSDESVAYVTEEGKVYAVGVGTTAITATTANGLSDAYEVSVIRGYPKPEANAEAIGCKTVRIYWEAMDGVSSYNVYDKNKRLLDSTTGTQYIATNGSPGSQATYYVEAVYEDGEKSSRDSAAAVCWTSPEKATVTVDKTTSSYVTLTWTAPATADHYYIARSTTTNMSDPDLWQKVLTTTFTDTDVVPGQKYYYQVNACVWDSVSKGSDLVSVTIPGGSTTVNPTGITLDHTDLTINNDIKTLQLTATVLPSNATNKKVTWSSDNEDVAIVDSNGVVTIIAEVGGSATITAKTSNGHSATCKIEINDVVEIHTQYGSGIYIADFSGGFDEELYTITVGETLQMTGSVKVPAGIGRVTVKVDGYYPDGEYGENRYASRTFGGETSIDLEDYSTFTINGNSLPFNVPGLYTMKLWATDNDGNFSYLDSTYVQVKADETKAKPTIYVTIGSNTKQYKDGDHLGAVYNDVDNTLWIDAHFTNTLRAWYRIEYPDDSGLGHVHSDAYNVADIYNSEADAYSWYRVIPKDAVPGIYEIKIDALNSSVENDQVSPRTRMTLTLEVKDPADISTHRIPSLGITINYGIGEFFTTDHKYHGNDKSYDKWLHGAHECWGFALYVMDAYQPKGTSRYKLYYTTWNDDVIKNAILASGIGAHIRTNSSGHSYIVTDLNLSDFSIVQANGTINGEYTDYKRNIISKGTWTWSSYFDMTYGNRGVLFTEIWATSEKDAVIRSVRNLMRFGDLSATEAAEFVKSNVTNSTVKEYSSETWQEIIRAAE